MSKIVTVKHRVDLPLVVGADVLAAVERMVAPPAGTYLVEVRLHRAPDGELSLATVTSWTRVQAITAAESDLAWARRNASTPRPAPAATINDRPVAVLPVYPTGSLKARLQAKRALQQTGS
ncbi:MAG: hypothetical protein M3457_06900 [Chloroflexota bacterium]|nr:hypothetical protein [Chloroflexota bacterium]